MHSHKNQKVFPFLMAMRKDYVSYKKLASHFSEQKLCCNHIYFITIVKFSYRSIQNLHQYLER